MEHHTYWLQSKPGKFWYGTEWSPIRSVIIQIVTKSEGYSLPQSSEERGFEFFFQSSISNLPQILSIGDIVRLHRIKVDRYRGLLQAKSSKGFAAVVFERDPHIAISEQTARVSSKTFTFSSDDKEVVQKLKNWRASKNDLFQSAPSCKVADVTPNTFFDMVCQVTAVRWHQNIAKC